MKKQNLQLLAFAIFASFILLSGCKKKDDNLISEDNSKKTTFTSLDVKDEDGKVIERIITIKDFGEGIGTKTFTSDNTYILDGMVFVNDGQTLTIEAGTIIKGKSGQERDASALVIARGGKIYAEGTAEQPIIFCSEADNTHYDHIEKQVIQGENIPHNSQGLWGGLIILGKGKTNNATELKSIEGIPTSEQRARYGGTNDNDNSGIIKYISIRNGGTDIGEGNEINGLTMGAVGSGTTIEYIEVIGNKDDGFEWFGGTVNCKYLISAFNGDDSFDYDESYRGNGQFWLALQNSDKGDRIGEHDGGPSDNEFATPYAIPNLYNVTYIGRGKANDKRLLTFRDNAGGHYVNSIFVNQAKGIDIEYLDGSDCSYDQFTKGNLTIEYCQFFMIADDTPESIFNIGHEDGIIVPENITNNWVNSFETKKNKIADPGISYDINNLKLIPTKDVSSQLTEFPQGIEPTNYKGAFDPLKDNWVKGWSKTSQFIK